MQHTEPEDNYAAITVKLRSTLNDIEYALRGRNYAAAGRLNAQAMELHAALHRWLAGR